MPHGPTQVSGLAGNILPVNMVNESRFASASIKRAKMVLTMKASCLQSVT